MKFEYKTFAYPAHKVFGGPGKADVFEQELNTLGAEGWELVNSIDSAIYTGYIVSIFKRAVPAE